MQVRRPLGDDSGEKEVAWRKVAAAVGFWYNLKMELVEMALVWGRGRESPA